ncbi:cullin-4A [Trichonephila clavipes]|nr:cullin-4A [Trichonephila clavipes]
MVSDADCGVVFLGSNPGEVMGSCKCIVHWRHESTLNSLQDASPLMRLVEERWKAPENSEGVFPQNWSVIELNHAVNCTVLKATGNYWRICSPLP